MVKKYNIFHISDLHFGSKHAKTYIDGADIQLGTDTYIDEPISEQIFKELPENKNMRASTIVICSGDLATFDQPNDFRDALIFLNRFKKKYDISPEKILLVPGNHDVFWKEYKPTDDSAMLNLFRNKFRNFRNPLRKKDGPCYYFRKHRLLIYLLNSCVLSGAIQYVPELDALIKKLPRTLKKPMKELLVGLLRIEPGFIGNDQIRNMEIVINSCLKECEEEERELILKIAVLHHHVNPIYPEFKNFASVVDAVPLKRELSKLGFHIVMHGHKHYPYQCLDSTFMDGNSRPLAIISSGTMGGQQAAGVYYSFNLLEVQNNTNNLPKVILYRKEFESTGYRRQDRTSPSKITIEIESSQKSEIDKAGESLREILSDHLPTGFGTKMFDTQKKYQDINPIQVEHYKIKYDIKFDKKSSGDHFAHHFFKFKNISLNNIDSIYLSLSGSSFIKFSDLGVKAIYKYKRRTYPVSVFDILEDGYIKIIKIPFKGKGIPSKESAIVEINYFWPNTVELGDCEWGLENWMFKKGIKNFTIRCELKNGGKFKKAIGISSYYDVDRFIYKISGQRNLDIPKNGKIIEWTSSLKKSHSIHFIRCSFS